MTDLLIDRRWFLDHLQTELHDLEEMEKFCLKMNEQFGKQVRQLQRVHKKFEESDKGKEKE